LREGGPQSLNTWQVKGLKVEYEAGPASSRPDVQQIDALKAVDHESRIVGVDVCAVRAD